MDSGACKTIPNCKLSQALIASDNLCKDCPVGCLFCSQELYCYSCSSDKDVYLGSCVDACPISTYSNETHCLPCNGCSNCKGPLVSDCVDCTTGSCGGCPANCDTCYNGYCLTCSQGFRLTTTNVCEAVTSCPLGQFLAYSYSRGAYCLACPPFCRSCASIYTCNECYASYSLIFGACKPYCPFYTYPYGGRCYRCH
jgi:hypothetical protein